MIQRQNLKKKIAKTTGLIILLAGFLLITSPAAIAQGTTAEKKSQSIFEKMAAGAGLAAQKVYGVETGKITPSVDFATGLLKILNTLLTFIGIIFFLFLLYAGYIWMMARGAEEEVNRAKKMIQEIITGFIIILVAKIFTIFILTQLGQVVS